MDRVFQYWRFYEYGTTESDIVDITVKPFCPKNISCQFSNNTFEITGHFGEDVFTNDNFKVIVDGVECHYTSFHDIPEQIDHVLAFTPDPEHDTDFHFDITTKHGTIRKTINCHHLMEPWEDKLVELLKREKYASSM